MQNEILILFTDLFFSLFLLASVTEAAEVEIRLHRHVCVLVIGCVLRGWKETVSKSLSVSPEVGALFFLYSLCYISRWLTSSLSVADWMTAFICISEVQWFLVSLLLAADRICNHIVVTAPESYKYVNRFHYYTKNNKTAPLCVIKSLPSNIDTWLHHMLSAFADSPTPPHVKKTHHCLVDLPRI